MSEDREVDEKGSKGQSYLQTVIECIAERKESRVAIEEGQISELYGKADNFIKNLDSDINRCMKYNEARINRKYQIIIHDLQAEIKRLQDNLKLEQDARSPTKKHVSDILEKLVQLRAENEALNQENTQLKQQIKHLQDQIQAQNTAINKLQYQHAKGTIERLPPINTSTSLLESVKDYLKDREQVRKLTNNPVTKLEKLLNQLRPKLWNWNIGNLLEEIDKWSEGVREKDNHEIDMWKIRSSVARKFSDYIDRPQHLLRPSVRSEQTLWDKLEHKSHMNAGKFSYLGSRRSLNGSFH